MIGRLVAWIQQALAGRQPVEEPLQPGPTEALLLINHGRTLKCDISEQFDPDGGRTFVLDPVRPLQPGETVVGIYVDRLPPHSRASVLLPQYYRIRNTD